MPIIKSAIKRMRQTTVRRSRNVTTKKNIKNAVKAFHASPSAAALSSAQSELDTAVKKNVLKRATAARRKSALSKVAKTAGVSLDSTKKKAPAAKKPASKSAATKKKTPDTPVEKPAKKR